MRLPVFAVLPLIFTPVAFAQTAGVPGETSHYALVEADNGKIVGSTEANVAAIPGGYQFTSHGELTMAKFSYSFSNDNRLDSQLNIVHDHLNGSVNGTSVAFSLRSDSTGRQFQISIESGGKTTANTVDRHQNLTLLPDLDPAAYISMAHFAIEHPATTWVIIPKQNGLLLPAKYTSDPDLGATFRGQSLAVHHATVIVSEENGITVELYYTNDGQLLEADLPEQNFYVIRDGFHLQSRPHYTPPQGAAPPQGAQQPGPGAPPQNQ